MKTHEQNCGMSQQEQYAKKCTVKRCCYLAGPMSGIREFNFPAFHRAAAYLRDSGYTVFNPAQKDIERCGVDISQGNKTGSVHQAELEHGFSLRQALADDCEFICLEANCIALLPGWENSRGAQAEWALARALGLEIIYLDGMDEAASRT
jgi:Domain of unknown function (DUF4406)